MYFHPLGWCDLTSSPNVPWTVERNGTAGKGCGEAMDGAGCVVPWNKGWIFFTNSSRFVGVGPSFFIKGNQWVFISPDHMASYFWGSGGLVDLVLGVERRRWLRITCWGLKENPSLPYNSRTTQDDFKWLTWSMATSKVLKKSFSRKKVHCLCRGLSHQQMIPITTLMGVSGWEFVPHVFFWNAQSTPYFLNIALIFKKRCFFCVCVGGCYAAVLDDCMKFI